MARKAKLVNETQFKNLMVNAAIKVYADDELLSWEDMVDASNGNIYGLVQYMVLMGGFLPKVLSDWKKVKFDFENFYCDPSNSPKCDQLGFQTLENDFTYLGIMAGGDWEQPIYAIIYHDGSDFRGYIPNKGNTYNTITKTAFGSESESGIDIVDQEEEIRKGLASRGIVNIENIEDIYEAMGQLNFNFNEIRNEIQSHINISGTYSKKLKEINFQEHINKLKELEEAELADIEKKVTAYHNNSVVYAADGKSEYVETVTVYEYHHMISAAKDMMNCDMTLSDFINIAEMSENVETFVSSVKQAIRLKKSKDELLKLFGEE